MKPPRFTWALAALGVVMALAVASYLGVQRIREHPLGPVWSIPGGDATRGLRAIQKHGCTACHTIPGVPGPRGRVCPTLEGFASRKYIGGQLTNTPENLIRWIMDPHAIATGTAMPDLGVTEEEARDIAAYLYRRTDP